ncbi:MAG: SelL-related redox protein, partial [Bacteroidota bacterium]
DMIHSQTSTPANWERRILLLAAIYHVLIGLDFLIAPTNILELASLPLPSYIVLVRLFGVLTFSLGLGLCIQTLNLDKFWMASFLMWVAKLLSTLVFGLHILLGDLPIEILYFVAFNDMLWVFPMGKSLWKVFERYEQQAYQIDTRKSAIPRDILPQFQDQFGRRLDEAIQKQPTLLVFLRHFGCTFCRETMKDLARDRAEIEAGGTQILVVHMEPELQAEPFFEKYGLSDVARISDPEKELYEAFSLERATFEQAFGWKSWLRGVDAGLFKGLWVGKETSDGWQMPGAFLIYRSEILRSFRHQSVADRPDYCELSHTETAKV